jgi:hypothetical protein
MRLTMQHKAVHKILIASYHGCTVHPDASDKKTYISDKLLKKIEDEKYEGFYGITQVGFATAKANRDRQGTIYGRKATEEGWILDLDAKQLKVTNITENLKAKSKLELIEVSTNDDSACKDPVRRCGSGYRRMLAPLEAAEFKRDQIRIPKDQQPVEGHDHTTVNPQLADIAQNAAREHHEHEVVLDYVTNKNDHYENALKMDRKDIPANVKLRIFFKDQEKSITHKGDVQGAGKIPKPVTVQKVGKFSVNQTGYTRLEIEKTENTNKSSCCFC